MDFIKMNGAAVRLTGIHQRTIPQDDGPPLQEFELVVILRGTVAQRGFVALLANGVARIDVPEKSGAGWTTYDTEIVNTYHSSSGGGEGAVHRHDITLRETPESAARRAAEQPEPPEEPAPKAKPAPTTEPEPDDDPYGPLDLSQIKVGGGAQVWATALRQMTAPTATSRPAAPPEPPLETAELAGAEAVLVGLRLEALIEQLVAAGMVRRSNVDASFMRLVQQRFLADATPVIGAKAAKRAAKAAMQE
jgi:hypothetical protein